MKYILPLFLVLSTISCNYHTISENDTREILILKLLDSPYAKSLKKSEKDLVIVLNCEPEEKHVYGSLCDFEKEGVKVYSMEQAFMRSIHEYVRILEIKTEGEKGFIKYRINGFSGTKIIEI